MNSRLQLRQTLSFSGDVPPPRYESEFSEEVLQAWRAEGRLGEQSPEEYFQLDPREALPVEWRRKGDDKFILESERDLERFRRAYDPGRADRLVSDWDERMLKWRRRDSVLSVAPWNEGFLQVMGVADGVTFNRAIFALRDRPALVEAAMDHYAAYLEALLGRILGPSSLEVDYAVFYVPIASNHAPVLSPADYARFVLPAMRRVAKCLDLYGVAFRFIWATGGVRALIPLWLEAGINGLILTHTGALGLSYAQLRRQFGPRLRLMGGIDWRTLLLGPQAIDEVLEESVRPLLEQGGYVPHLDDTVRQCIPFDNYAYYRRKLDALVSSMFGQR